MYVYDSTVVCMVITYSSLVGLNTPTQEKTAEFTIDHLLFSFVDLEQTGTILISYTVELCMCRASIYGHHYL